MVRVGISVEGTTEERFVQMVLSPYLAQKQVYITPISMGGDVKLDRVKSELKKIANSFDYVTTFYDFYGFKGKLDSDTKANLEQKMHDHAHASIQAKLIPYVQMYEFEGLLFSCPTAMGSVLTQLDFQAGVEVWANGILAQFESNPEKINDSPQTAPSKRLESNTNYRKTTHGPNIAKQIGMQKLRDVCVGFNDWVARLEQLAAKSS
jgi:hypothetical protein